MPVPPLVYAGALRPLDASGRDWRLDDRNLVVRATSRRLRSDATMARALR